MKREQECNLNSSVGAAVDDQSDSDENSDDDVIQFNKKQNKVIQFNKKEKVRPPLTKENDSKFSKKSLLALKQTKIPMKSVIYL